MILYAWWKSLETSVQRINTIRFASWALLSSSSLSQATIPSPHRYNSKGLGWLLAVHGELNRVNLPPPWVRMRRPLADAAMSFIFTSILSLLLNKFTKCSLIRKAAFLLQFFTVPVSGGIQNY